MAEPADTTDPAAGSDSVAIPVAAPSSGLTCVFKDTIPVETAIANLRPLAKYKARSHETSKNTHIPLLQSCLGPDARPGPTVVFVGDSMIERMLTTGGSPNFPEPWPSPFLMDDESLRARHGDDAVRFDRAFNAGVGGDKIENLIYRLVGSEGNEDEEKNLPGLLPLLAEIGTVKVWVLMIGTNNLSPKKGMPGAYESMLARVIEALLSVRRKDGKRSYVIVSYLFPRKDVPTRFVKATNEWVKGASEGVQGQFGAGISEYLEAPVEFDTGEELREEVAKYLDDHVHLNLDGYRLWAHTLYGRVDGFMKERV